MKILKRDSNEPDALELMNELSKVLEKITGSSGRGSFNIEDVRSPRSLFAVAYLQEEAVGCGAIRPIDETTAEVKRMYARLSGKGIGSALLDYLEIEAQKMGYTKLILETRVINRKAVLFYESKSYKRIQNYGKYANRPESVCFEKKLVD
ncbi:MAG: acetyltransferase [Sporolactobacillus laevolacticus]|jgi:ribosomal protein S18 acetylase RimI-like enzyme|nr:acetyltransferase [Sporolactobacillus laevolacticus]